jgi:hypothetical protein
MPFVKGKSDRRGKPTAPIAAVKGRLFRVRGAAQYLGMTESRARTLVASGELIAVRNPRGRVEGVYEHDCDAWLARARRQMTPPAKRLTVDERVAMLPGADTFV